MSTARALTGREYKAYVAGTKAAIRYSHTLKEDHDYGVSVDRYEQGTNTSGYRSIEEVNQFELGWFDYSNGIGVIGIARKLIGAANDPAQGYGASVWQYSPKSGTDYGYLVGIPGGGLSFPTAESATVSTITLWLLATDNKHGAATWGSWQDIETGRVYFDISSHHGSLESALRAGSDRGEIAIWDLAAGEEVRVAA